MKFLFLLGLFLTGFHSRSQPGISAHRGASGAAPENTLSTFREALKLGVDYIEIDVRTTKDGRLVILHDGSLDRTTTGSGPVRDKTLPEVKGLSAGKGFGARFAGEKVPTLEEVCALLRDWNAGHSDRKVNLYVDCKEVAAGPLVQTLRSYGLLREAVFYGSDAYLLSLRQEAPDARLMPSLKKAEDLPAKVQALSPYAFDVRWNLLSDTLVGQIHRHGIRIFSDALDDFEQPEQYRKAARMGIDVIQTDFVSRVREALEGEKKQ
ncbi:glycerophosphodiester phosphodiesterase [Larkinella soli]|uniref:glycerophosphodiester phosphodiesterase n=1 Tax=Larkinella soli TaxID=1770527 RepID=UPI000FFC7F60|nr:glycerophosphodiester phosphodiesterase family protein [Larkinella soli]